MSTTPPSIEDTETISIIGSQLMGELDVKVMKPVPSDKYIEQQAKQRLDVSKVPDDLTRVGTVTVDKDGEVLTWYVFDKYCESNTCYGEVSSPREIFGRYT